MQRSMLRLSFRFLLLALLSALYACSDSKPQRLVDDSIDAHGGSAFESFFLEFDFRNRHYTAARKDGLYTYTREFEDSTGVIKDVLTNAGLVRYRDGTRIDISDERRLAFTSSVNSVIYFALLPYGLNDDAVNKEWIKETAINGNQYDVIRVTFDKQGGGPDHEDVFLYFFHRESHIMDYFAYSYQNDGGGLRFREAINPRKIGGILFQDYINYKPKDESVPLASLESMFVSRTLEKLSEIKLENLSVTEYKDPQ
jgi:hypothetical protein